MPLPRLVFIGTNMLNIFASVTCLLYPSSELHDTANRFISMRQKLKLPNGWISGWEYTTDGKCEKMPSTRMLNVKIKSIPCFEKEGMIWIWPGSDPPAATLPSLLPPSGFIVHAEVCNKYSLS